MAITYNSDAKWGDVYYLKSDPLQKEYLLVNILLTPGKPMIILRRFDNEENEITVYEFETSKERDQVKYLENKDKEEP